MAHSAKSIARRLRLLMRLGKSLSQAADSVRADGVPDDVLQQALLLVDTPDTTNKWKRLLDVMFSRAILAILGIITAFIVIAQYARDGHGDAGVLVVISHLVLYIILASLLSSFVNFMVHGAHVRFIWALYAVFVSEVVSAALASSLQNQLGLAVVVALSVLVRYVTYMAFITGPSPAQHIILALFFLVLSLLGAQLVNVAVQDLFYTSSAASLAMIVGWRAPWMSADR